MPFTRDVPPVDACTLPTVARPLRIAELDALFATALHRLERIDARHLRLTLTGEGGLEETARDLAARESQCCSFVTFTGSTPQGRGLVTVPGPSTRHLHQLKTVTTRTSRCRHAAKVVIRVETAGGPDPRDLAVA